MSVKHTWFHYLCGDSVDIMIITLNNSIPLHQTYIYIDLNVVSHHTHTHTHTHNL